MNTWVLAFEGGGTRTVAGLYDAQGALLCEAEGGPCNPVAYGFDASAGELVRLGRRLIDEAKAARPDQPEPEITVAAGVAGAVDMAIRRQMAMALCIALPAIRAVVTEDLHPMLHANARDGAGVLVIAGTGANVLGQAPGGASAQAGGRGSAFGDEGSAYQIALLALRHAARAVDGLGPETLLTRALPEAAGLDAFPDLTPWANAASKRQLANLARTVDHCAAEGDIVAQACIEDQARRLAQHVLAVQQRLDLHESAPVFLNGGLFEHSARYREAFDNALEAYTGMRPCFPERRGHHAAAALADLDEPPEWLAEVTQEDTLQARGEWALPATEAAHADGARLDALDARAIVEVMGREDARAVAAADARADALAELIEQAAATLRGNGRIVYIGAGTSGRLGALDAAECPPTFGVAPDRVIALVAGGDAALRASVEGAEDDAEAAVRDVAALNLGPADLAIGIAASGETPYVLAGLDAAGKAGAPTVLLCCNPRVTRGADAVIALDTGPEIIAGSTRLKAGTATKIALNRISTGAFVRAGYVRQGRMIRMQPRNAKLKRRAVRIVAELAGVAEARAEALLENANWNIEAALAAAGENGGGP